MEIGDLVFSPEETYFIGIGKISAFDKTHGNVDVVFFRSPLEPEADKNTVPITQIQKARLYDEQVVYCRNPNTGYWQRARYGGPRPNGEHLLIFRQGEHIVVGIESIYVPAMAPGQIANPLHFLKARCTDTPLFSQWRLSFLRSYIEQRACCRSMGALISSSIELEKHQLAVVRRVLQDEKRKYLLADEVGLGKTIEAALILREQLLSADMDAKAVVGVPEALIGQWREELSQRFHLEELLETALFVIGHKQLAGCLEDIQPDILVIDEAHQLSPWAWSDDSSQKEAYCVIASAAHAAKTCLLLSGTPLIGNEVNFLAMLHLLSPDEYSLDSVGIESFKQRVVERERLGGLYQAFVPENDNATLEDLLQQLERLFPQDRKLLALINKVRPRVDFFADESGEDRKQAIVELRQYIGEHYRLHQRMLRNRREDPAVSYLFPGLAGADVAIYHPPEVAYCLEQYLEDFRAQQAVEGWSGMAINPDNFKEWVADALVSPLRLRQRIEDLQRSEVELTPAEAEVLQEVYALSVQEQKSKDQALLAACESIWSKTSDAKLVVFCGEESVADHVWQCMRAAFGDHVERHHQGKRIRFMEDGSVSVFVCDRAGEDGINLNGGRKVVIHYDLPLLLPRIEQRLGRVNRYSALIRATPVHSLVLLPEHGPFSHGWFNVLDKAIKIFNRSVASLQYVLEAEIEVTWNQVLKKGPMALIQLQQRLEGEEGLIVRESKRVRAQEELNRMEADIQLASDFAEVLEECDGQAEEQVEGMMDWITQGLQFERWRGESPDTFRFKYRTGTQNSRRTLMDVASFLRYCYPALEREQPDPDAPVTVLMSAKRKVSARGENIHPMRYGSPFVEVIYRFMADDPRGISTAVLRSVDMKLDLPLAYLGVTLLLSKVGRMVSRAETCKADESFPPKIIDVWVDREGNWINNEKIIGLLEKPYQKIYANGYQDRNIRSEYWSELEEYFPERHWTEMLDNMTQNIKPRLQEHFKQGKFLGTDMNIEFLAARLVILVGRK